MPLNYYYSGNDLSFGTGQFYAPYAEHGATFSSRPIPSLPYYSFWISDYTGFGYYYLNPQGSADTFTRILTLPGKVYGLDYDDINNILIVGYNGTLSLFDVSNLPNTSILFTVNMNVLGDFVSVQLRNNFVFTIFTSNETLLSTFMLFNYNSVSKNVTLIYQYSFEKGKKKKFYLNF